MTAHRIHWLLIATVSLLAAGMSGCSHKQPAPAPQASTAPPLPPTSMTQVPPVPRMPAPSQPQVKPPGADQRVENTQPEPPRHPRRVKKHPATTAAPADPTVASQAPIVAAAAPPPAPSLGQLSAGGGADSRERAAMSEQIHSQEVRLGKLKLPLSEESEAILEQIRVFLSKARQAVGENDLDGAQTLTTKAKVLLDELPQS